MYEAYFGLKRSPFSTMPEPGMLFLSPQHQRALSLLEYALRSRAGFCVITGAVGSGKTTLVRRLLSKVKDEFEIGLVSNTNCESFEELLQWILLSFDLEYRSKDKVELYDTFVEFLVGQHRRRRRVTLIIDEAQHLSPDSLEQLRMLSNVNTERGFILQMILVGQPELWEVLRRPELEQFAQRISYDYYLGPFDDVEITRDYIRHRLRAVGGDPDLFAEETYPLVWECAGGIPRLINLVCDAALVYSFAEQQKRVGLPIVEQVIRDKENSFAPVRRKATARTVDVQPQAAARTAVRDATRDDRPSTIERAIWRMNKKPK